MTNKIALCFIISYEQVLYKEHIWREWIEPNKDIINVYFFYKDITKIRSKWILQFTIPPKYICNTSYYHVIPAYLSILNFALSNDPKNKWFCFVTDSCCPIISSTKFRLLFEENYNKSIMKYSNAHWNIQFHRRANLSLIPKKYHLANDPWFILTREHALDCINFMVNENKLCNLICQGGLANESLFAIILLHFDKLKNVIPHITHITDWSRMSSATSPHLFKDGSENDIKFIENALSINPYVIFIRKIHPDFPDQILREFINKNNKNNKSNNNNVDIYQIFSRNLIFITKLEFVLLGIFLGILFISFIFWNLTK
jgi:hypothetical protein